MTLRPYKPSDLDALYALDVVCFDPPFRFTRSAMRRFAEARRAHSTLAEDAGQLLGFCITHVQTARGLRGAYIVTLDVAPSHRRQGLARVLMQAAEQQAIAANCTQLALHVFTGNAAAIAFYEQLGFTPSHRESGFYGMGLDAFVYRKQLSA
jgi:ribosomal-protein-alanine N-acetyltransferase